jgi:hypothetical protein
MSIKFPFYTTIFPWNPVLSTNNIDVQLEDFLACGMNHNMQICRHVS